MWSVEGQVEPAEEGQNEEGEGEAAVVVPEKRLFRLRIEHELAGGGGGEDECGDERPCCFFVKHGRGD